jgi:hypothetical protein
MRDFSMIGTQDRWQDDLFVIGTLRDLIPEDHLLRRVDEHLDPSCFDVMWRTATAKTMVDRASTRKLRFA